MQVKDNGTEDADLYKTTYHLRGKAVIEYNKKTYVVPYTYEETTYEGCSGGSPTVDEVEFDDIIFPDDITEDEKIDFNSRLEKLLERGKFDELLWG